MKVPTGYYDSPAGRGKDLDKEFVRNVPIKHHKALSSCQIDSFYENVRQKFSLSKKRIVDFRMISLNELFNAHL